MLDDGDRVDWRPFHRLQWRARSIGLGTGVRHEDWSAWLPCDRMQSLRSGPANRLPPYSETVADTAGWHSSIPLQHCTVKPMCIAVSSSSDAAIEAKLLAVARGGVSHGPRVQRLVRGRPEGILDAKLPVVAGETIDPLDGTALHLTQSGITRFLAHFPVGRSSPTDAAEYNRLTADEYDRLRDLLVLHYHATRRTDSEFWNRCREMSVPDSLARRLALFADSGRITAAENEHCGADGWLFVLLGQGLMPRSYDPLVEAMPLATAQRAFAGICAEMRSTRRGFAAASGFHRAVRRERPS